jgi:hypothetical protein
LSNLPAASSIGKKAPACSFCTSCEASACFGQAGLFTRSKKLPE